MKINEVEVLVGISKKNIRFYEEQGLLSPRRNADNGYREYGEEEVQILRSIKWMRKLGLPIEEIRQMFAGTHTVGDGMRRHLVSLEREQRNLAQSIQLCRELQNQEVAVTALDAEEILARMEEMEQNGTSFQNKQKQDGAIRYAVPIVITMGFVAFLAAVCALMFWSYHVMPEEAPPVWFLWLTVVILAAVGVGAILALIQRIHEIGKGEIDDARHY